MVSLQGKITAVFLLMTLLATQVIGSGLLYQLQQYYLGSTRQELADVAQAMTVEAADAMGAGASLTALRPLIVGALQPPASGALLLTPDARIVFSSGLPAALVGRRYPLPGPLAGAAYGRPATAVVRTAGGQAQIWSAAPVRVSGRVEAVVAVEGSATQIYYVIRHIREILLTWTLLALALTAGLSLLLGRTVTGPLEALTRRARAMAAGDFAGRLPVRSRDEVGQLALVFNHLARRLQETLDEIRGAERRAAAILANMTDGLLALDAAGRVLLCNPAASAMLAVDAQAVAGRPAAEALPPALARVLEAAAAVPGTSLSPGPASGADPSAAAAGRALGAPGGGPPPEVAAGAVLPLPLSVGGRHLLAHVAPLVEGGRPGGSVIVIQDVTERERLELERKEFVANVSHDLRTPLTTIRLYAESLLEWALADPEEARAQLQIIAEETGRMAGLIDELLELSLLDAQGVEGRRRMADLRGICAAAAARLAERARQKGVEMAVVPGPAVEAPVDADRIVRVVTNLLTNAIDFTDPGGTVTVTVSRDGPRARVTVADTGIGIPAEDLPRIFDRFYRVDASRSREYGGSGLGLAIAREIVEAHGGRIEAESPGRGTIVRFDLPLDDGGPGTWRSEERAERVSGSDPAACSRGTGGLPAAPPAGGECRASAPGRGSEHPVAPPTPPAAAGQPAP